MLSDRLTRALARVVLASYLTHVFAPVVQAMEVEQQPTYSIGMHLRDPLPQREFAQQQEFRKNLVTLAEQFKEQEGLTDLLTLAESLAIKESLNFKKRALREEAVKLDSSDLTTSLKPTEKKPTFKELVALRKKELLGKEAVKLNPTDLITSTEPSEKKLTFKEIVAARKKELLGKEAPRLSSSALTVPTVPSRIRTPFQEALAFRRKELLEKDANSLTMIAPIERSVKKAPVQELIPHQQLPTLSIKLDHLSHETKGDLYRLSIDQTRHFGSKNIKTDHKWEQELSLNGSDTSSPINHPWMRYLNLHLSESGTLTAQSLMAFSITETSGFYQGYNYCFQLAGGLHLNNLLTDGQIDVPRAHRISAEGEVYGQEGIFFKAKQEIKTRSTDPKHPTLVHSKKRITLKSSYLDNENSHIKAPIIEGALGRRGQRGPSLDNTKGIIEAVDLLSLPMAAEVFNEGGTLNATSGKTKISTFESLLNKRGVVGGKRGLDLTVEGSLQNPNGILKSKGTTNIKATRWANSEKARVSGHNIKGRSQTLLTDDTSYMGAQDFLDLTSHSLHQESPLLAKKIQIQTIRGLDLATTLATSSLSISTETGPIVYKPKGLRANNLLSVTSKKTPLTIIVPIKSPGAFEATAPKILNKTTVAIKDQITLNGTSTDAPYPVHNEGDLISARKGLTINAEGFNHTKGHLQVAGDAVFPRALKLKGKTYIGGNTHIYEQTGDIDYNTLIVQGLLHLTFPGSQSAFFSPIRIPGQLEIDREGGFSYPFLIGNDLIAKKGVKLNLFHAPLTLGSKNIGFFGFGKVDGPAVKIQAEDGFLEIQSKSLDIVKAELFARTGMRWEVQEDKIHIGRGVVSNIPLTSIFETTCLSPLYENSSVKNFLSRTGAHYVRHLIGSLYSSAPFKHSNGTMVITEGPFTVVSPQGILIDQAEVQVKNKSPWDITTQEPVRNEGGNVNIQGHINIHGPGNIPQPNAIFQNVMLTQDSYIPYPLMISTVFPYTPRAELTVSGNFAASGLENIGSFAYIAGSLSCPLIIKDVIASFTSYYSSDANGIMDRHIIEKITGGNFPCSLTFPGDLSSPKSTVIQKCKNPQLEGVIQTPLFIIDFEGQAMVGRMANYQRQATPPFQQMKMFMDVYRPTALFRPAMDMSAPWINQPTVPLSWKFDLPPAVGLGPDGLYLLDPSEKLILHPMQEVDFLPSIFNMQLRRGYLDENHPEALATYIMGRHQAYDLYLKLYAPKAFEGVLQARTSGENPEQALRTLDGKLANSMTEQEMQDLKFMVLYYRAGYENKNVHLPLSWLSHHYDDPRVRNPDGGVFARVAVFKGKTPDDILHCVSNIHGEDLLGINVARTILERQSHRDIIYYVNTTTKKGSWLQDDKMDTQIVAIYHDTPQPNTGNMTTGKQGQVAIKSNQFEFKNGAHIDVGKKGIGVDIDTLIAGPSVQTTLGQSYSEAGGTTVTQYYPVYDIQPALVTSEGGIKGRIDKLALTATHMIAFDKGIHLRGKVADLLAHRQVQYLGATVTQEGRAVTVTEKSKEFALPCVFRGDNCEVLLSYEDRLHGEATQYFGKIIDLESKDIDIETLFMRNITRSTSSTQGKFSKLTTDVYQESPEVGQSLFVGDKVHFRGGQAKVGGAYIKTGKLFDHTKMGLALHSIIKQYYYRQETKSRQPMAHSEVGKEGGQDVRIPTTVDADAIIRLPEGHVLLTDQTIRRVQKIPGDDNACGFASILWHLPSFDPLNAREIGVELLLKHLNSSTLQAKICTLIAPEIMEWALIDSDELASFPEANIQIRRLRQAQEELTQAVRNVNSALNLQVSLSAEDLLALLNEKAKDFESSIPNASLTFASLRLAHEGLESAKAEVVAWASDPGIVGNYIQKIIAQPGHMLGYGSGPDGSTGTMDALAQIADVNLFVYREDEGQNTLVHAHKIRDHGPVVELLHTPYSPKESMIPNHFNRLEPYDPNSDTGKMQFVDTVIDEEVTKIIGAYEKTHIELTNWSRSWAEHHQVIPNEALVVVALAVGLATQGVGVKFLAPMLKGITAASGMQLSAMGTAMVNAGFTTVCSNLATSTLATGDLVQVGKDLTSKNSIRSIGISMLSAGLCHQIGSVLDIDTNPSLKEVLKPKAGKPIFMDFLKSQALKSGVNAGLNVAIGGESVSDAMKKALKEAPLNAVAAWAAYNIGDAGFQGKLTPEEQDVMHSIVGAALGAAQNPDKLLAGAATGAANALIAARASKIAFEDREGIKNEAKENIREQGLPVTKVTMDNATSDILHQKTAITQLLAASATALITRDAALTSTGISVATNVVENNCIPSTMKSIPYSAIDPEAKLPEDFWDKLGTEEREVKRRKPGAHARHEKHLDGLIEETVNALNNPNLTTIQRIKLQHSLNNLWKAQAGAQSMRAMKTFSERDIQVLRYFKTYIEQGTSQLIGQSLSNLDDPTLPKWQQASSFVNWLMYQNMGLAATLLPATNGEVGLTVLPWFKSAQATRVLHSLNPAKFFQLIGRAGKVNILPAQELKLLPAPKMVKHHVFNVFRGNSHRTQKYRDFFELHNIQIDNYAIQIPETFHRTVIHAGGNDWTKKWISWIDANQHATIKDVYQFAGRLMDEYNVSHIPLIKYK